MKRLLVFCLVVAACNAADDDEGTEEVQKHVRFIHFPDGDGNLHEVDLDMEPDWELLEEIDGNVNCGDENMNVDMNQQEELYGNPHPAYLHEKQNSKPQEDTNEALNHNKYYLYTRRNRRIPQILLYNNARSVLKSNFKANLSTVVVVHGWFSNHFTDINPVIRKAYLDKTDVNVIIMDWGELAHASYPTASAGAPIVGRHLGQFMAFLNKVTDTPFKSMHLIGFSLGAHIVGNAGRELDGKIGRITGLDPAGPLWTANKYRLNRKNAVYVEAIHTNSGLAAGFNGIAIPVADNDFFPNGGSFQPGCLENVCNHNRSWKLFAATVTFDNLVGYKCFDLKQAKLPVNACRGKRLLMGTELLRKPGRGLYGLNTKPIYPY